MRKLSRKPKSNMVLASAAETNDLLKVLTAICLSIRGESTPEVDAAFNEWLPGARETVTRFKMATSIFDRLCTRRNDAELAKDWRRETKAGRVSLFNAVSETPDPWQKTLFDYLMTYFNSQSDNAWKQIGANVRFLNSKALLMAVRPDLNVSIRKGKPSQKWADFVAFASKLKPDYPPFLSIKQINAMQGNSTAQEYNAKYKAAMDEFKQGLERVVASYGTQFAPAGEVLSKLETMGLPNLFMQGAEDPKIWVDAKGNLGISPTGDISKPTLLTNPKSRIELNPKFNWKNPKDPKSPYVFKTYPEDGGVNGAGSSIYTKERGATAAEKKARQTSFLMSGISTFKTKWRAKLTNKNYNERLFSTILELAYLTTARLQPGGGKSKGEDTFGVVTWCIKHIKTLNAKEVSFSFPAKSGKPQNPILKPAEAPDPHTKQALEHVITNILEYAKGKEPNDLLFIEKTGRTGTALSSDLKKFMAGIGITDASPHKIRHARGTELFLKLLEEDTTHGPDSGKSVKEYTDFYKELLAQVGTQLGHMVMDKDGNNKPSGATAEKYYIDTAPLLQYFIDRKIRPSKEILKRATSLGLLDKVDFSQFVTDGDEEEQQFDRTTIDIKNRPKELPDADSEPVAAPSKVKKPTPPPEPEEEEEEPTPDEDEDGVDPYISFINTFPAKKQVVVTKVLDEKVKSQGKTYTRRALVEKRVADGWKVELEDGERCLISPEDTFFGEDVITKAAMDYAEFLGNQEEDAAPSDNKDAIAALTKKINSPGISLALKKELTRRLAELKNR